MLCLSARSKAGSGDSLFPDGEGCGLSCLGGRGSATGGGWQNTEKKDVQPTCQLPAQPNLSSFPERPLGAKAFLAPVGTAHPNNSSQARASAGSGEDTNWHHHTLAPPACCIQNVLFSSQPEAHRQPLRQIKISRSAPVKSETQVWFGMGLKQEEHQASFTREGPEDMGSGI